MKSIARILAVGCIALAFMFWCAGCGGQPSRAATNSSSNAAKRDPDYVALFLSESQKTSRHGDGMQINSDAGAVFPDAAMLHLVAAIRRYPGVNRFRVTWGARVFGSGFYKVATYNRKLRRLQYMETIRDHDKKPQYDFYSYEDVSSQMLCDAGSQSIKSGTGNAFSGLDKYGGRLIIHRRW